MIRKLRKAWENSQWRAGDGLAFNIGPVEVNAGRYRGRAMVGFYWAVPLTAKEKQAIQKEKEEDAKNAEWRKKVEAAKALPPGEERSKAALALFKQSFEEGKMDERTYKAYTACFTSGKAH